MLGFTKPAIAKALQRIAQHRNPAATVEDIIKQALSEL